MKYKEYFLKKIRSIFYINIVFWIIINIIVDCLSNLSTPNSEWFFNGLIKGFSDAWLSSFYIGIFFLLGWIKFKLRSK